MSEPRDPSRDVTLRVVPQGAAERAFDDAFWQTVGPEARLLVMWDTVLDHETWMGREGGPPRLDRSVVVVSRLPRE